MASAQFSIFRYLRLQSFLTPFVFILNKHCFSANAQNQTITFLKALYKSEPTTVYQSSSDAAVENQLEDEPANTTSMGGIENPTCNLSKDGQDNQRGQKVGSVVDEDSPGRVTVHHFS